MRAALFFIMGLFAAGTANAQTSFATYANATADDQQYRGCNGPGASCNANHSISQTATYTGASAQSNRTNYSYLSPDDPTPFVGHSATKAFAIAELATGQVLLQTSASRDGENPYGTNVAANASLSDWLHFDLGNATQPVAITITASLSGTLGNSNDGSYPGSWGVVASDGQNYVSMAYAFTAGPASSSVSDGIFVPNGYSSGSWSGAYTLQTTTFLLDPSNPNLLISLGLSYQLSDYSAGSDDTQSASDLGARVRVTAPDGISFTSASGVFPGSASNVPEPATWSMMILGFGAIGATMRRRRAVAA